jgi:hypothetical protein
MKTCKEALTSKASRKPTKEDFLELIHEQECTEVITDLAEEVENGILEENSQSQELWWSLDYSKGKTEIKVTNLSSLLRNLDKHSMELNDE